MNNRRKIGMLSAGTGLVMAIGSLVMGPMTASAGGGNGGGNNDPKVTICHASNSETNPYEEIEVAASAVDGSGNSDHMHHTGVVWYPGAKAAKVTWGDIIKPVAGITAGLNWPAGQTIYGLHCNKPPVVTTTTAQATTTTQQATTTTEKATTTTEADDEDECNDQSNSNRTENKKSDDCDDDEDECDDESNSNRTENKKSDDCDDDEDECDEQSGSGRTETVHHGDDDEDCPEVTTTTTEEATTTTGVGDDNESTTSTTQVGSGGPSTTATAADGGTLPRTGAGDHQMALLLAGLTLICMGLLLIALTRRPDEA